jgi:hypothetical protein
MIRGAPEAASTRTFSTAAANAGQAAIAKQHSEIQRKPWRRITVSFENGK